MWKRGKAIEKLDAKVLKPIKAIVLDVDGVVVPRGTEIKQKGSELWMKTKTIPFAEVEQMRLLAARGFHININSGRSLWMLQQMFFDVLPFVSLTYENGSATWFRGEVEQHVNIFKELRDVSEELRNVRDRKIKGFEPKEFIVTVHCSGRVEKIERIVARHKKLYTVWNGEAYDIGVKGKQTKAVGLKHLTKMFRLKKKNVLAIGDNFNDRELLAAAGIAVSADVKRVGGDFYVPLGKDVLPAQKLMARILEVL